MIGQARIVVVAFAALLAAAVLSWRSAQAQTWPQRTVKLMVPFQAGSAADVTARLFADRLAERWGRSAIVEDRPGPDGLAAVTAFASAHDDHTLFFSNGGPVTINPVIHDRLPYDPQRDLVPIASASDSFLTVAASANLAVNTVDELIARARAELGKLTWAATPGLPLFTFAGFAKTTGLAMIQVSYRDFSPALQDVAEGRIGVASTSLLPLLPLAQSGKVKLLVVTNRGRSPAAPDLPTAVEIGHPELAADGFQGFFGWRDMPEALRERIAADIVAVADPALGARLAAVGQALRTGTTADFVALIEAQRAKIASVAAAIGVMPQ